MRVCVALPCLCMWRVRGWRGWCAVCGLRRPHNSRRACTACRHCGVFAGSLALHCAPALRLRRKWTHCVAAVVCVCDLFPSVVLTVSNCCVMVVRFRLFVSRCCVLLLLSPQALHAPEEFQHILRILNTNVDGRKKVMFALTSITGVGRRLSNLLCKKADVDMNKRCVDAAALRGQSSTVELLPVCQCRCRSHACAPPLTSVVPRLPLPCCSAGELTEDEITRLVGVLSNPLEFKIPKWFLNRRWDIKTGAYTQVFSNALQGKLREDLERLKKMRAHRGLRHYWGLRVKGQHTKTTGRRGTTVGFDRK